MTSPDHIRFEKLHGAGNDYVYVDGIGQEVSLELAGRLAAPVADRHFGVGGDGLILLAPSATADVRMVVWNADGSRAKMCGNGLRCLAKLARELGHVGSDRFAVETDSGVRDVELIRDDHGVTGAVVEMGTIEVEVPPDHVTVQGLDLAVHRGDAGNPHAVIFVDEPEAFPVLTVGAALQEHPLFEGGVNVEFVAVRGDRAIEQRTFERGSGETLACGSGATVAAVAALRTRRVVGPSVTVRLRGGEVVVHVRDGGVFMEGPATSTFRGELHVGATLRAADSVARHTS